MDKVEVGQIWSDCSRIQEPRYLVVEAVLDTIVQCRTLKSGKKTNIRKNRMWENPKGYSLVKDPKVMAQLQATYGAKIPAVAQVKAAAVMSAALPSDGGLYAVAMDDVFHYLNCGMPRHEKLIFFSAMEKFCTQQPGGRIQFKFRI